MVTLKVVKKQWDSRYSVIVNLSGFADRRDLGMEEREGLKLTAKSWGRGMEEWDCCSAGVRNARRAGSLWGGMEGDTIRKAHFGCVQWNAC